MATPTHSRDAMRFTTLVPALEEQLSGSGMLDLGTVPELKANLARVLSVATELRQADRISRIRSLQERLNTIEAEAIIRYGAAVNDPSMELVVFMKAPADLAGGGQRGAMVQSTEEAGKVDCPICMEEVEESYGLMSCTHRYCQGCFTQHFRVKIEAGEVAETQLQCPHPDCGVSAHSYELESVLPEDVFSKYLDFLTLKELREDQDACWCPNQQCGEAIMSTRGVDEVLCPMCQHTFCKACHMSPWHAGVACDEAQAAKQREENGLLVWMQEQGSKVKPCPGCREGIEKNDGCNHMTCSRCQRQWCWLCVQDYVYGHFNEGPCEGLQFARGDTLAEARAILNPDPIREIDAIMNPPETGDISDGSSSGNTSNEDDTTVDDPTHDDPTHDDPNPHVGLPAASLASTSEPRRSPPPSRAAVAGALALTICTAGLAAPFYIKLRKKHRAAPPSRVSSRLISEPTPQPVAERPIQPPLRRCSMLRPRDRIPDRQLQRPQVACGMRNPRPYPQPRPQPMTSPQPIELPLIQPPSPPRPDVSPCPPPCGMRRPPSPPRFISLPPPPPVACRMRPPSPPEPQPQVLDIPTTSPVSTNDFAIACGMRKLSPPRGLFSTSLNLANSTRRCGKRRPPSPSSRPLSDEAQIDCGKRPPRELSPQIDCGLRPPSDDEISSEQIDCGLDPESFEVGTSAGNDLPHTPWSEKARSRIFNMAKMMLQMLETIEDRHALLFRSPAFLLSAWRRFEVWIRLLAANRPLAHQLLPPLDVAFIWHAYMIRTEIYLEDLPKILHGQDPGDMGMAVAWKCVCDASSPEQIERSRALWAAHADSGFDDWQGLSPSAYMVSLPFQLTTAFLLEDLNWLPDLRRGWPRFADPHQRCPFLNDTLEAYVEWLETTYRTPVTSLKGPAIDVDAFWHSHMLNPGKYKRDIEKHYGVGKTIWHRPLADGVIDPSFL